MALSKGYPFWTLSSVLPCGARTFLPNSVAVAAITRPASPFFHLYPLCLKNKTASSFQHHKLYSYKTSMTVIIWKPALCDNFFARQSTTPQEPVLKRFTPLTLSAYQMFFEQNDPRPPLSFLWSFSKKQGLSSP